MSIETSSLRSESHQEVAAVLLGESEAIVNAWARRSRVERGEAIGVHWDVLKNSLPDLLHAIGEALDRAGDPEEDGAETEAVEHGAQRWSLGWRLDDVVEDYQLLRVVAHEFLEDRLARPLERRELMAMNLHVDDAISASVAAYVGHQEDQLNQAHRRFNEFLSVLGHELRNPLNALSMALQVMGGEAPDERAEAEEMARDNLAMVSRLLGDMLDVTRITRGQLSLERRAVELADVVRRAERAARSLLTARRHALEIALPEAPVWVEGDGDRLDQILGNLLTNAAKYTDPGGRIRLAVEPATTPDGPRARVSVSDNGRGIEPSLLPHVFDLFVQAPEYTDRGLGVGLALVKTLVEMHGGRIEACSDGVGHGSTFVVDLPVLGQVAAALPQAPNAVGAPAPAGPGRRILIVDDTEAVARLLARLLKRAGHDTFEAHDGEEALEVALRERPDVILLDIGLPKLDGREVARRLRARPETSDALIVAMTGFALDESYPATLVGTGFDRYLVKPVSLPDVLALLASPPEAGPVSA